MRPTRGEHFFKRRVKSQVEPCRFNYCLSPSLIRAIRTISSSEHTRYAHLVNLGSLSFQVTFSTSIHPYDHQLTLNRTKYGFLNVLQVFRKCSVTMSRVLPCCEVRYGTAEFQLWPVRVDNMTTKHGKV